MIYQENQVLHSRLEDIRQSVLSWGRGAGSTTQLRRDGYGHYGNNPASFGVAPQQQQMSTPNQAPAQMSSAPPNQTPAQRAQDMNMDQQASFANFNPQDAPSFGTEPWTLRPAHQAPFSRTLAHPDLVHACPDIPRPLDILHGTRSNFLAEQLNKSSQRWPLGEPERLAGGLLVYGFVVWASHSTRDCFAALCDFQRPVGEQLARPHHFFIDFIWWPRLRANMIKHADLYDPADAMALLTCCQKVRWPWREPLLLPSDDGG